ncbi:Mov34/MPN/PAD-1 family protein [Adhaeribacter aquaticus]|uniref:Mov34/MPN/PAD-1 family protein n=1 Tax=Adhaeribacter aquaticus TaxID=299567 RepID=UPI00040970C5|nr:Mov34/MPN/PAD-1 family protein [Adhaeribacter aquaticus]
MSSDSTTPGLLDITSIELPRQLAQVAIDHFQRAGRQGVEGVALFAGNQDGATFYIRRTIIPEQEATQTEDGLLYFVPGPELTRINRELYAEKLILVAQIHSHPTVAYHSDTDDAYAIITEVGGFSIVVPYFGRKGIDLSTWEIYRLEAGPEWAHLPTYEKTKLFNFIGDEPLPRHKRWYWPWH